MIHKKVFLRWVLMASVTLVGAFVAFFLGWFGMIDKLDTTKLSFAIIAVFAVATAWGGMLFWRFENALENKNFKTIDCVRALRDLENDAEHGWFAVGMCEKLGLTGTVFGFVIMLVGGFQNFQAADPQAMQQLLERLSTGMSTAFVTTLVGVICSIALSVQFHYLARVIEREKP
jgi:hypothetical protein